MYIRIMSTRIWETWRTALIKEKPAEKAHTAIWSYPRNTLNDALKMDPPPRASSVMAIIQGNDNPSVLFIVRSPHGPHGNQLAFPGGRQEKQESLLQCALRETHEELGIDASQLEILGELSPVFIPPSHHLVYPFVARAKSRLTCKPQPDEIADWFWCPFSELTQDKIIHQEHFLKAMNQKRVIPGIPIQNHFLWGATAMMIAELIAIWNSIER